MKNRKLILAYCLIVGLLSQTNAQDNLLDILDEEHPNEKIFTAATFKMTRISYGQSIETRKKGTLETYWSYRFWNIPNTRTQSFFADKLSGRLALEYGVTDRFSMGVGYSNYDDLFDGFLKYKLVRQQPRNEGSPISITLFQGGSYNGGGNPYANNNDDFNRLSYTSQVLIARKFNSNFSFQIAPTIIHRGMTAWPSDPTNTFAMGFGGRFKINGHLSFVSEYYWVTNPLKSKETFDPFSLGLNWEIGGLMFQCMLTNTRSLVEDTYLTQTPNSFNFKAPNINLGLTAIYIWHLKKKKHPPQNKL